MKRFYEFEHIKRIRRYDNLVTEKEFNLGTSKIKLSLYRDYFRKCFLARAAVNDKPYISFVFNSPINEERAEQFAIERLRQRIY